MLYLNKLLDELKKDSKIFKDPKVILRLGLTATDIKNLKKYALENQLITQVKQEYFLTEEGEKYLVTNTPPKSKSQDFTLRPELNVEYLKEEKTPAVLTKAIRAYAKFLIENVEMKENSLENALQNDIKNCKKLYSALEADILNNKRNNLNVIFEKYLQKNLTKSLIACIVLTVLVNNLEKTAIYEKSQFQLKFDALMFDRMIACPENFEIQKTEMPDEILLKDISKIILNKKSNNILEITKRLYKTIKTLDKYTMHTENLSKKTLRLRNAIVNAKDPISLFERDIPKALGEKSLKDCDRKFLNELKISLKELKNCTENLVKDLKTFFFESFKTKSRKDLNERFLVIKEYIGEKELKILFNNIVNSDSDDELWINRIATFINKSRVPKDWSDEDYADFKIKTKELALKFFVLESTVGTAEKLTTKNYHKVLNSFLNLTKAEQMILLRKAVNEA